jgi:NitT/TauT family transport system permease protein
MVSGTILGIIAGRIPLVFDFADNIVWVFMATPSVVWVFIFAVAIGVSDLVPVLALTALLAPQILINVAEGAKSIPKDLLEMTAAYKATRIQRLADVYLQYLLPYIVASARASFALDVKIILVAEVVGLSAGIGYVVKYWDDKVFLGPVVAWGVLLTVFGIAVDFFLFRPLERHVSRRSGSRHAVPEAAPSNAG